MWLFKQQILLALISCMFFSACVAKDTRIAEDTYRIHVVDAEDTWGTYLFNHLIKRVEEKDKHKIQLNAQTNYAEKKRGKRSITIRIQTDAVDDYCIGRDQGQIQLIAKNQEVALWLVYQLISALAVEDQRIDVQDLAPATLDFSQASCGRFDFDYREVHLSPQVQQDYAAVNGGHYLGEAWGIWGHNLTKIIGEHREEGMYALVDDERVRGQLSFSSPRLLQIVETYIIDNYGEGDKQPTRFMLMPEDNDSVCLCAECVKLGNTKGNATPAVAYFLNRLAKRFPKHNFFTTAYRTTQIAPKEKMRDNVGVMISTIDLPKGVDLLGNLREVSAFEQQLTEWKRVTDKVYLWDYIANFDDYLSPHPSLLGAQKQLKYFKDKGVKGVFLNGSGYDYMPFDDVKTFVLNALLKDVNADVLQLITAFYKKEYPMAGDLLSAYYLHLEQEYSQRNQPFPLYGGFEEISASYFNANDFVSFYEELGEMVAKATGAERRKLQKLYIGLTYTRLQVAYVLEEFVPSTDAAVVNYETKKKAVMQWIAQLQEFKHFKNIQRYKEVGGSLVAYSQFWQSLLTQPMPRNSLATATVVEEGWAKQELQQLDRLTDGLPGYVEDYHQGWYSLSKNSTTLAYTDLAIQEEGVLTLSFLQEERHRYYPPQSIEVYLDDERYASIALPELTTEGKRVSYRLPIDLREKKTLKLIFFKQPKARGQIAIDEIDLSLKK